MHRPVDAEGTFPDSQPLKPHSDSKKKTACVAKGVAVSACGARVSSPMLPLTETGAGG